MEMMMSRMERGGIGSRVLGMSGKFEVLMV